MEPILNAASSHKMDEYDTTMFSDLEHEKIPRTDKSFWEKRKTDVPKMRKHLFKRKEKHRFLLNG